jgi:hypothetical protein
VLRAEVRPAEMRLFAADVERLVQYIRSAHSLTGDCMALASDRVWHCGRLDWYGTSRDVLFARGLLRKDSVSIRSAFARKQLVHPIVLVPLEIPPPEFWTGRSPAIVQLSGMASMREGKLEIDAHFLTAVLTQMDTEQAAAANVFRSEGDMWVLRFDGKKVPFHDSVGLEYIAHLLSKPYTSIPAIELFSLRAGIHPRVAKGSDGEILDRLGKQTLQRRFAEAKEELDLARKNHDVGKIEDLQREMTEIASEVRRATGLGGRLRKDKTDADKVRKSVSTAVSRAIDHIKKEHETLGRHLKSSIFTGYDLHYSPERSIAWMT